MLVEKILVANRGEIACRVIKTIQDMGFTAVAIFSEADKHSLHVKLADESIEIGPAESNQSYLNIERIIQAAKQIQADAIHPGYGFLSENSDFAQRCKREKLIFIGPTPDAIKIMGSKSLSKAAMIDAGVPCIPGYQGEDQSDERLIEEASKIGFPLMVKAAAGGGGRGMRKVVAPHLLPEALQSARSEALSGFGSAELILEKAIESGRHIEIQILADSFGHCIHLGERDCSLQRRHQKVIEESPSPLDRASLREKMGRAAIKAAESCQYIGAGTVEFLVDDDLTFYFLEMNTRIQVEHPVTELVTNVDIVEQQIRIAIGEPLRLKQHDIELKGHAIEARLYAEDPVNNYMPQSGPVILWKAPSGKGIRVDTGIEQGQAITPFYDPMIAKIIGYGESRTQAIRYLTNALRNTHLCGIKTNRDFLIELLEADYVREGQFDTSTLQSKDIINDLIEPQHEMEQLTIAALIQTEPSTLEYQSMTGPQYIFLTLDDMLFKVELQPIKCSSDVSHYTVNVYNQYNGEEELYFSSEATLWSKSENCAEITFDNIRTRYYYAFEQDNIWISNRQFSGVVSLHKAEHLVTESHSGQLTAPMDGKVIHISTYIGEDVVKGQTLAIIDAMKIEHPIQAPFDGSITGIHISANQQVKNKQLLITLAEED